ncbi:2Fe-2S iron-sulfur cluster-binding protein [Candidatus Parabeggiatoa sp. HSG14]|uniref:2Fe-2S iron-sulfur cluster-binding protein n=1 Tax=Candidatus Parabeggiatoa sp. HSG14 TaxID=3055593 RepID=UPI0025A8F879|nr:2Fe-2S iron-sulfur cluster-binding protein [Thiotrichales bacterium HSG14]
MNTQELTLIIFFVVAVQVAIFALIASYRHWLSYEKLKKRLDFLEDHQEDAIPHNRLSVSSLKPLWTGFRDFRVQRKMAEDKKGTICSFFLMPVDEKPLPSFKPGQFLTFQLNIKDGQTSKKVVRCYSLSDKPSPDYFRVTIKRVLAPSRISDALPGIASNYFHDKVREGDILAVKAPAGHFYWEADEKKHPIVLIGSGIGITPMLSILNANIHSDSNREIWFYYGVRNSDEHIMKNYLEEVAKTHQNLHLHVIYSKPKQQDSKGTDYYHEGHIDVTLLRMTLLLKPYQFYVCGPKQMMETLVPDLSAWGVPDSNIHYETFGPSSLTKQEKPTPSSVEAETPSELTITFSNSKKTCQWNNSATSLLEFAEENGIPIDSGCRAGNCGCCQTAIESGEVEYVQSPDIVPEPGTGLLCVSVPKTHLTLSA